MRLAVATESRPNERRIAVVPDVAKRLVAQGWSVVVQSGAGDESSFLDQAFESVGASLAPDMPSTYKDADVILRVNPPSVEEVSMMRQGAVVISFFQSAQSLDALRSLVELKATVFSFDLLPRISRAQSMDALSSQATVSGYRSGLAAAEHLSKFFPMFMTAAGTVPPAKVLVMGVGVAGLQAIATARRLGAVVRAYDVRAAAKEEAESLGATFVELGVTAEGAGGYARELTEDELRRQQENLAVEVAASDVIITTAAVPGRTAPILLTTSMVDGMGPGSVVIDMAADSGGNCELTQAGKVVNRTGTRIIGLSNPASTMPTHASFLYARNAYNFLSLLSKDGSFAPDWQDEIVLGTCILRAGSVCHGPSAQLLGVAVEPILAVPTDVNNDETSHDGLSQEETS